MTSLATLRQPRAPPQHSGRCCTAANASKQHSRACQAPWRRCSAASRSAGAWRRARLAYKSPVRRLRTGRSGCSRLRTTRARLRECWSNLSDLLDLCLSCQRSDQAAAGRAVGVGGTAVSAPTCWGRRGCMRLRETECQKRTVMPYVPYRARVGCSARFW